MANEIGFQMAASNLRFGAGITREIGMDLAEMQLQKVMLVTDPIMAELLPVATVRQSLEDNGVSYEMYDRVRVEPSDASFKDAATYAIDGGFDGFVAVGGGSSMDTAKAANLYSDQNKTRRRPPHLQKPHQSIALHLSRTNWPLQYHPDNMQSYLRHRNNTHR